MIESYTREIDEDITQFLRIASYNDESRADPRWRIVYNRLREIAIKLLASKSRELTLTPGELVHEAYVRLFKGKHPKWKDRGHFFHLFGRVMRHVLVDYYRRNRADKYPSYRDRIPLQAVEHRLVGTKDQLNLDLKRALGLLEMVSESLASIVRLHYLDDVPLETIAKQRHRSLRTIKRELRRARALLSQFLTDQNDCDKDLSRWDQNADSEKLLLNKR